jgi:hypothetical protein
MELRNHPLMCIGAHRGWPPTWVWVGRKPDTKPVGATGILKAIRRSVRAPVRSDRLFLIMEYEQALYMSCLLFDDRSFCEWLFTILHNHIGEPIEKIGNLDVSETL